MLAKHVLVIRCVVVCAYSHGQIADTETWLHSSMVGGVGGVVSGRLRLMYT